MRKSWLPAVLLVAIPAGSLRAQVQQDWVARYNGPKNLDNMARAITTDSAGNVYVAGVSCTQMDDLGNCVASQYVTLKYDAGGHQLWVATYSGPGNNTDEPTAIAIDSANNVYVTGGSCGDGTLDGGIIGQYDKDGNQLSI